MLLRFPKITGMLNEGAISKTQTNYDEKTVLVGAVNRDLFHPQSLTNIDHIRIADSIQLRNLLVGRAVFSCNTGKRITALHGVILCG